MALSVFAMALLTVPVGYAFNLYDSSIYCSMVIALIARALNIPLSWATTC